MSLKNKTIHNMGMGLFLIIAVIGLTFGDDYLSAIVPPFLGLIIILLISIERTLSRNDVNKK